MRNKKIVAFVLFFSMILTSAPVFGATDTSGHWAEESIEKMEANKRRQIGRASCRERV